MKLNSVMWKLLAAIAVSISAMRAAAVLVPNGPGEINVFGPATVSAATSVAQLPVSASGNTGVRAAGSATLTATGTCASSGPCVQAYLTFSGNVAAPAAVLGEFAPIRWDFGFNRPGVTFNALFGLYAGEAIFESTPASGVSAGSAVTGNASIQTFDAEIDSWMMRLYVEWKPAAAGEQLTITIPENTLAFFPTDSAPPSGVPEPGTAAMAVTAGAAAGCMMLRRKMRR